MLLTTWTMSEIFGAVILLITGLYIYYKFHVYNFWRKRNVFSLEPTFLIGNTKPLLTGKLSFGDFIKDIYERRANHGFVGIYMLHKPSLMINDLDLIRDVLTKEFTNFHDRGLYCNEEIDPLSGHLFLLPGKKWRNLRVKLTPTFTSGKIKQMFPILKITGDTLANFVEDKARLREVIEAKDLFLRYSIDIIASVAFGITCDSFKNPNNEFGYWGKKVFDPKPLRNACFLWAPQIFDLFSVAYTDTGVTNFFTNVFKNSMEHREANNIVRNDFLNLLMQLMKNGYVDADDNTESGNVEQTTGNKLTMAEASAQAYVFYLAGFETSSTTATFCLYELAKHKDVQDKVRNEIQAVIEEHGDLTYNAVNDMTYLHKVISETMRKYPAIVLLNRICTKETKLENTNFSIPSGTQIVIPVYGIHRDPNIYPEPKKFDPERFSEENIKTRHPYGYLPFGEGPRICIGLRFGLIQTKIAVISALLKNTVKLAPNTPTELEFESGALILRAKEGVNLIFESDFVKDMYERYVNHRFVGIYMLHKPSLMINDLDLIRDVLTKEFTNFHDRGLYCNEEIDPLTGNLFLLPGKKWRNLRVKLTPTFTSGKIKQMFPILKATSDTLANFLEDKARLREVVEVKDIMSRYSMDVIMSVAFGITCDSFKNRNNDVRYWGLKVLDSKPVWNALFLWAPEILNLFSIPYLEKGVTNFFLKMLADAVEHREANSVIRKDFLNLLMQLMKNGYVDANDTENGNVEQTTGNKLTMAEASAQAFVFYLGGFETSAATATFCLYELAKHKDVQDKVRNEIQAVIEKHGDLTYNAVNDMTYLHKVISETMRKYPAIVLLNRICTKDRQLENTNFSIPSGTQIVIPVFGIHMNPNIYPEPKKFDPERFSEENIKTRHPYAYLPFGEGPRMCIGLRFGLMQTKIAVISALLKNTVKLAPNTPTELEFESGSLVLVAKEGVNLIFVPMSHYIH
ncbi:putative cytochrome P450 6a14 [Andrena cerasifolii]|uniref:putative cytochrome P450 6a14 n=1 Tax=Andrena cerasifolii TaxID=2819439 RepID=UPI004037D5C0